jgi:SAM-dependent methyltransferase
MVSMAMISEELFGANANVLSKDLDYYEVYEKYLSEYRHKFTHIAEIGVYRGESLKVLSRYFAQARILGVDIELREIDFAGFDNITYVQCDQTDDPKLTNIAEGFSASGFDLIIDDACHVGYYSLQTFNILFSKLRVGGFYVIEDWGTGYWDDWPDGCRYQGYRVASFDERLPKRLPSHDFGMVGLVKMMVDIVGMADIRPRHTDPVNRISPFEYVHFYHGMAIIKKRSEYRFDLERFEPSLLLETRNRSLETEIAEIRRSRSWRFTQAMRSAVRPFLR